jgi:hypothetical protein
VLTFKEAMNSMKEGEKPSVLLGNGFSQAFDKNIFNYSNLLEAADFGTRKTVLKPLFKGMGTYDFEVVMKQLVAAQSVLEVYGVDDGALDQIKRDKKLLKEALIFSYFKYTSKFTK